MINTVRLRAMLGWLGILLPWIVLLQSILFGYNFPDSISATYYVETCITPFMIILGSAALLLMSYKGYDKQDDVICTLAGIAGLLICIFPCNSLLLRVGTFQLPANVSGVIHNISAVIFFLLLAYNSLFLFTKTNGIMTESKRKRNRIFVVCGIGMVVSLIGIIPVALFNIYAGTWAVEAIALAFFGISWLTKSNIYSWLYAEQKG